MGLKAIANEAELDLSPIASTWQLAQISFRAHSTESSISFTDTGGPDTYGSLLDAVVVRKIADPNPRLRPEKNSKGPKPPRSRPGHRRPHPSHSHDQGDCHH